MSSTLFHRLICAVNIVVFAKWNDWFQDYFQPEANAGNWLAALAGAFVIRFARPQLPIKASIGGWLVGFILACLFAPDVMAAGGIWFLKRSESNYAFVAFIGDAIIQIIAWVMRLSGNVGNKIEADPSGSFDATLERVEKVTSVWVRIKTPFLDLLSTIFPKKP